MAGYAGIGGTARKLKRVYVGVNGVARRIKRMYIGVNGVARLWYKGKGTLTYQGTATALSTARANLSSANTTNRVLFAGGSSNVSEGTSSKVVNSYNRSLTMTTASSGLSVAREFMAGTSLGGKALFAGGSSASSSSNFACMSNVDVYDDNLTRQTAAKISAARDVLGGASVGGYALFGGGYTMDTLSSAVDTYDTSLTKGTASALSAARAYLASATHKNYALFAGGINSTSYSGGSSDAVDAYNSSLTRTTATAMSAKSCYLAATRVGKYVIFAGGGIAGSMGRLTYLDFANAYNESLTRTILTALSKARSDLAAAATENYAMFVGGAGSDVFGNVDVYDDMLTRTTGTALASVRTNLAGGAIGDYAMFAGGGKTTEGAAQTTVYAYKEV